MILLTLFKLPRLPILRFLLLNNSFSIINNYNWQVAPLTRCHETSGCLVLGIPLLSSWWTATSIWSTATFVTWIGVPPSQIGMLSILKVQLQTNRACRPLHLSPSVVKVRSLLGLEASSALIYNGYIQQQHQPSWYLPILPSNVMKTLQTITELQVRDKFWCAFKIGAYL